MFFFVGGHAVLSWCCLGVVHAWIKCISQGGLGSSTDKVFQERAWPLRGHFCGFPLRGQQKARMAVLRLAPAGPAKSPHGRLRGAFGPAQNNCMYLSTWTTCAAATNALFVVLQLLRALPARLLRMLMAAWRTMLVMMKRAKKMTAVQHVRVRRCIVACLLTMGHVNSNCNITGPTPLRTM